VEWRVKNLMSDVIAVLMVCNEKLVCIDYDRPVWLAKNSIELRCTPNINHFVVDGLLATLSNETLKKLGITKRFGTEDFEKINSNRELNDARKTLYTSIDLDIKYFHDFDGDIQIHQDLARFKMPILKVEKLSTKELLQLAK
jgi:hypothetical protein